MSTPTDTAAPVFSAGTYDIDPVLSRVGFAVKHLGINVVRGKFHRFAGTLEISDDLRGLAATGVVEAGSVDSGFVQRDEHLRTADFFYVENNPDISFTATGAACVDGQTLPLNGDITIRGVTRPIVLAVELAGEPVDQYDNVRRA